MPCFIGAVHAVTSDMFLRSAQAVDYAPQCGEVRRIVGRAQVW